MTVSDCQQVHPDDLDGHLEQTSVPRTCDFRAGHTGKHRTTWVTDHGSAEQDEWEGSDGSTVERVPYA